jgi:hypothetical protein
MVVIIINNVYYSGNFWWTNKYHLTKLPDKIDTYYTAPEDLILLNKDNIFCSSNCGKDFKPLIMRMFTSMFTNRRHHYLIKLNHFGFN